MATIDLGHLVETAAALRAADVQELQAAPAPSRGGSRCLRCLCKPCEKAYTLVVCWGLIIALLIAFIIVFVVGWEGVTASAKSTVQTMAARYFTSASDTRLWRRTLPEAAPVTNAWAPAVATATVPTIASGWIDIRSAGVSVDLTIEAATPATAVLKLVARPRAYPAAPIVNLTTWAGWTGGALGDGGGDGIALQHQLDGDALYLVLVKRKGETLLTSVRVPS